MHISFHDQAIVEITINCRSIRKIMRSMNGRGTKTIPCRCCLGANASWYQKIVFIYWSELFSLEIRLTEGAKEQEETSLTLVSSIMTPLWSGAMTLELTSLPWITVIASGTVIRAQ